MPSGWLGILLGKKLYIECPSSLEVPNAIDKIVDELKRKLNVTVTTVSQSKTTFDPKIPPEPKGKTKTTTASASSRSDIKRWNSSSTISRLSRGSPTTISLDNERLKKLSEIKQWNEEKVRKAVHTLGFANAHKLTKVNGKMLYQMMRLYKESPQLFAIALDKTGLNTYADILQLTSAFDDLIHQT